MKQYKSKYYEADADAEHDKSVDAIKDLIDTKWSTSDDEKGKALNMLKGLIYADTPAANKFLKELDDFTSGLNHEDYK